METLRMIYEYIDWIEPWDRHEDLPKMLLDYVIENHITDISELKREYLENFAEV